MINKINLYFKSIDKSIFEQLRFVNKSPIYEEFSDRLESVSDGRGKIIAMFLAGAIIIFPVLITLMFWWGNLSLKNSLQVKKGIAQVIHDYKLKEAVSIPLKSRETVGALPTNKEDFLRIVNLPLGKKKSVTVEKLKYKRISKSLGRSVASIRFNNLTTKTLVNMVENLVSQHKSKISRIRIEKDKVLKTLGGIIEIVIHGNLKTEKKDN